MRKRYYFFTGIVAYLLFLITTIPAAPVIGLVKDRIPVSISNVSGTLWNGRAGMLSSRQNIKLHNIEWSFVAWRLLLAKLSFDVAAVYNDAPVSTRLSSGITGTLAVSQLNMKLDAAQLASLISLPLGELSGELDLNIDNALIAAGAVPRVNGSVNWNRAAITVAETADLGNIAITINESEESPLAARIKNSGGHLALNGDFTTTEQGDYSLQLTMKPNASASSNLESSLGMFAKKQRSGDFLLNNKGNLKQLGLM